MPSTFAQRVQLGPFFSTGVIDGAAKLEHYEAGTSTLKNLWSDRAMTTTLAQPFVADADGIFNFFADGLYKLVIKKADNTVLYTLDDWQFIDRTDPTFGEGSVISTASTIAVGPEIFAHLSGSTNVAAITGTIPFVWLVADGNFSLIFSANLIVPAGIDLAVRQNDVLFFLNDGAGVWRLGSHYQYDGLLISTQDSRTNTVDPALTIRSTTSGTPAAGIGTGILLQAESTDENPADFGQLEFAASDVGASEDTYFQILLRVAGAALSAAYRFVATSAFRAIFTHANTADRTYTWPNRDTTVDAGDIYMGPSATGSGSTAAHEGTVTISASQALSGIHFYTDFTLDAGDTLTIADFAGRLCIVATGTITINGTIDGVGAGSAGGTAIPTTYTWNEAFDGVGLPGMSQPGGGGGGAGGGGVTAGTAGVQLTGETYVSGHPMFLGGGSGGGSGAPTISGTGGTGGNGGASIILIAPTVILGAASVLNTSGAAGSTSASAGAGGGGGGGAGNVYVFCRSFTDNGATFTQTGGAAGGGAGGSVAGDTTKDGARGGQIGYPCLVRGAAGGASNAAAGTGANGGAGAAGVKQINIYA